MPYRVTFLITPGMIFRNIQVSFQRNSAPEHTNTETSRVYCTFCDSLGVLYVLAVQYFSAFAKSLAAADSSLIPADFTPTRWRFLCFPPFIVAQNLQLGGASRASCCTHRRQFSQFRQF
jgi:hypothetical protein